MQAHLGQCVVTGTQGLEQFGFGLDRNLFIDAGVVQLRFGPAQGRHEAIAYLVHTDPIRRLRALPIGCTKVLIGHIHTQARGQLVDITQV